MGARGCRVRLRRVRPPPERDPCPGRRNDPAGRRHPAWVLVLRGSLGTVAAWRQGRRAPSWRLHTGALLAGWGAFNLVEGIVDHHLLGVHHVRDDLGGPLSWDLGFLALGLLLLGGGWALSRSGTPAAGRSTVEGPVSRTRRRSAGS